MDIKICGKGPPDCPSSAGVGQVLTTQNGAAPKLCCASRRGKEPQGPHTRVNVAFAGLRISAPSSLGIYLNNNLVAVRFERTKIRLKRAQRIFGPVSRLSALSDPLHEFFLTSDKGLALGNVPIRLGEMPTLLVCHRYSSSRRT
jgi:hypothetical protein